MRIGQLARKYDIPVQDLLDYLEEIGVDAPHPNGKLFESLEAQVLKHFDRNELGDVVNEPDVTEIEEITYEEEERSVEEPVVEKIAEPEPEVLEEVAEEVQPEAIPETVEIKPEEVILSDKLLEMIESGEINPELEKVRLIKAPKKELAGLKVLGKVELPAPKQKSSETKQRNERKNGRSDRPQLSDEEREKRRLMAKKKQQEYEARQEKRRKAKEQAELKARKQAHYQQKVKRAKEVDTRAKATSITQPAVQNVTIDKPKPKTVLGKFWRWLNT